MFVIVLGLLLVTILVLDAIGGARQFEQSECAPAFHRSI